MKEFIILHLLFIILISYSNCSEEELSFKVSKISVDIFACSTTLGTYSFKIEGEFTGQISIFDPIFIDLISPSGSQAECIPMEKTSNSYLNCKIDICLNSLNDATILLPLKTPNSDKYKILNWEEVIGAKEGESNLVVKNVFCLPEPSNTFTPSSIKSNGCSGTKNTFRITGQWSDESKLPPFNEDIKIKLDNEKKDIATCKFEKNTPKEIKCEFNGEGDIKFGDLYVKGTLTVYKLLKIESPIHVDKCSTSKYIFMNIIILSISLLLLF